MSILEKFDTNEFLEEARGKGLLLEEFEESKVIDGKSKEEIAKRLLLDSDSHAERWYASVFLKEKWIECNDEVKAALVQELNLSELEAAQMYKNLWDYGKAHDLYEKILIDPEKKGDIILQSDTLHGLWSVFQQQKKYQEAITSYEKALSLATDMNDIERQIQIQIALSAVYDSLKNFEEAYKYLDQALTLTKKLWNPELEVSVLFSYADTLEEAQNFEKAEEYYTAALKIAEEHGHEGWKIDIEWNLEIMHNSMNV